VKLPKLITIIGDGFDWAKVTLRNWETADSGENSQYLFLYFRGEPQHAHDLRHTGPGNLFAPSYRGMVPDFASGVPFWPYRAAWTIRNRISGPAARNRLVERDIRPFSAW